MAFRLITGISTEACGKAQQSAHVGCTLQPTANGCKTHRGASTSSRWQGAVPLLLCHASWLQQLVGSGSPLHKSPQLRVLGGRGVCTQCYTFKHCCTAFKARRVPPDILAGFLYLSKVCKYTMQCAWRHARRGDVLVNAESTLIPLPDKAPGFAALQHLQSLVGDVALTPATGTLEA